MGNDRNEQIIADLKTRIKSRNIGGSYIFHGDESYVVDYYRTQMYTAAKELTGDFGCTRLRESGSDAARDILDALEMVSITGGLRYCEVSGEVLMNLSAKDKKKVVEAIENGFDDICFVAYFKGEYALDASAKKDAVVSAIMADKKLMIAEFSKLTEANLVKWAGQIARAKQVNITPDAAKLLCTYCAGDMYRIESELEKLYHLSGGNQVDGELIKSSVSMTLELEAFELANAVIDGNYSSALKAIEKMKQQKEDTTTIIGAFVTAFSGMLTVMQCNSDGNTSDQIAKQTGLHPYRVKIYLAAGNRMGVPFVERALQILSESDVRTKSSRVDSYIIAEQLVSRLRSINIHAK